VSLSRDWQVLQKPMKGLTHRNPGPVHSVKLIIVVPAFIANFRIVGYLIDGLVFSLLFEL